MSKRLDVLAAVRAMVKAALPGADVVGLNGDDAAPARVKDGGRVVVRSGDPGDAEVDLSPLAYNYRHPIPIEIIGYKTSSRSAEEVLDAMMEAIGTAIEADRTLGGLCDWLEPTAPGTDDIYTDGAAVPRGADLLIVASYSTPNPLT
ncbi:hypothetical protein GGQ80_002086 [Sphingomonas jinjuensis]|uniref:Acyl-CoA transferase n=1 Tax=Sphingomonas jinjuensis TaxID=535907 RepID=A0A840FD51_9SPHN|nr:hypothetical protein [Sphingomonas jinjuensis]MBB4154176.1 hypothetical protein [Sphingomonas jinjuensis]